MHLDPFYPIVPDADWVSRIVPLGVRLIQLRCKGLDDETTRRQIIDSQQVCVANDCLLVVNDHWRAAIACGCRAVHLGQEDLADADLNAIRAAGMVLGVSTHDETEMQTALRAEPDYIALGPVFGTTTKSLSWSAQGLSRVTQWSEQVSDRPLVAIGGITLESAQQVLHAGADSVAVIGDIINAPDSTERVRQWLALTAAGRA